jgi:RNA polymerase sigma factor (sigma-70 family)
VVRSERWLTRRAIRGDGEAFAAIFRRHQQDLYRYCVAILADPDDAQDALQNTMVKALRALPGERREIALKPWLFRIAHNEAIELRRRVRPTEPLVDVELPAGTSLEQLAAERGRLRELLADLAALPVRQRGALVMRELAGFDFDQIGAALETTPTAARQVLYEARQSLREMGAGREMRCDAVTAILSDGDGRVARRRDVRAHLRDCPDCRAFAEEIRTRGETLAAIAPLPALAAAAVIKGALAASAGGAASGGAAAGGGAAGVGAGGTGAGGAGLAAGAAAKAGSTAGLVKSAIGVIAIVAVGAVAADRTHLVHLGGSGGEAPAARSVGGPGRDDPASQAARAGNDPTSRAGEAPVAPERRRALTAGRRTDRGARKSVAAHHSGRESAGHGAGDQRAELVSSTAATDAEAGRQARGADHSASAAGTVHPGHPTHPTHPSHPSHGVHPDHPAHPSHPAHPATAAPESTDHPTKPPKESKPKPEAAATTEQPVAEAPAAATAETDAATSPRETAPGQAKKAAREEVPAG